MRRAMMHGWDSYLIIQMHPTLVPFQTFDLCNYFPLLLLQRRYWLSSISWSPCFGVCCIFSWQLASGNMAGGLLEGAAIQKKESKRQWQDWKESSELATLQTLSMNIYFKVAALRYCQKLWWITDVSCKTNFCLVIWFHCCWTDQNFVLAYLLGTKI